MHKIHRVKGARGVIRRMSGGSPGGTLWGEAKWLYQACKLTATALPPSLRQRHREHTQTKYLWGGAVFEKTVCMWSRTVMAQASQ